MKKLMMLFAVAALVFGGVACGEDDPSVAGDTTDDTSDIYADGSPGTTPGDDTVDAQIGIVDFAYEPNGFTATAGEPVKWENRGDTAHTVTFQEGGIDSGNLGPDAEFSHTFEDAGEFAYFCSIHGQDRMSGTITVQ